MSIKVMDKPRTEDWSRFNKTKALFNLYATILKHDRARIIRRQRQFFETRPVPSSWQREELNIKTVSNITIIATKHQ